MPVIGNDKAFAVATGFIISLLVVTPVLVGQFGWFFAGHVIFGLTVGLMVGMTQSSLVSGVMPLLFAFAGGSIVTLSGGSILTLSMEDNRVLQQLETLGRQLAGFGIGTIIGLFVGVALTKLDIKLPLGALSLKQREP